MSLEKIIVANATTQIYIWKIEESFDVLLKGINLRPESIERLSKMKSEIHKCGFLSVRHLLLKAGYQDIDLHYDQNGKPYLIDGKFISITHSFEYSAIIISDINVGIDIEKQRDKIIRLADKFINDKEKLCLSNNTDEAIKELTVIWGAKEAMYKMCNSKRLSFKNNMNVESFYLKDREGFCKVKSDLYSKSFLFFFREIDNFILVYTLE